MLLIQLGILFVSFSPPSSSHTMVSCHAGPLSHHPSSLDANNNHKANDHQVGTLGSGLSDTVSGVAGGLGNVASGAGQTVAAPFTSAETKEGGEGVTDSAKGAADSAADTAGEAGGKASETAEEVGGKASDTASSAKDTVGDAAGEGQKKLGLSE